MQKVFIPSTFLDYLVFYLLNLDTRLLTILATLLGPLEALIYL